MKNKVIERCKRSEDTVDLQSSNIHNGYLASAASPITHLARAIYALAVPLGYNLRILEPSSSLIILSKLGHFVD